MEKTRKIDILLGAGLFDVMNNEPYFTWRKCDCCGGLAGDRYQIQGYLNLSEAKNYDNLYEYEICPECLEVATYGTQRMEV